MSNDSDPFQAGISSLLLPENSVVWHISLFAALSAHAVCMFYLCFVSKYSVNRTAHVSWNALHSLQVPQLSQSTAVRWDEVLENINVRAWGSEHSFRKSTEDSALNPGAALAARQTVSAATTTQCSSPVLLLPRSSAPIPMVSQGHQPETPQPLGATAATREVAEQPDWGRSGYVAKPSG